MQSSFQLLSWNIENARKAYLLIADNKTEIPLIGKQTVNPDVTTDYIIEALALDEESSFREELQIGVFKECTVEFKADKYYIFPTIPVTLSWKVTNAKSIELNAESVEREGAKVVEPEKATAYILRADDEFGFKEKRIDIQMLPVPQVKTLLVPAPKKTNNLAVNIKQPRYNVSVKFPHIDIEWIKAEVPKVPSLADLGINVELTPPLPEFSLRRTIKRVFNQITKR